MFSAFLLNKKSSQYIIFCCHLKFPFNPCQVCLSSPLQVLFRLLCRCDVAQSFLTSFLTNLVLPLTFSLQACLKYNPGSISCKYWKGVSHAALGNFFESVKSSTQVCDKNCNRNMRCD